MQIVTDSGTDLCLPPGQVAELSIHVVPLIVTLEGASYREGVDIQPEELYRLLEEEVVPLFYKLDSDGVPRGWVSVMKEAMRNAGPKFCTRRMVKEYTERFYIPCSMENGE